MKSPFKFLDAYTKEDRDIFFGREKEIEELYHRVFDSRILLVYGESGTGKSSLIQCGLANKFRDSDWLPIMIRRGDNLPDSIARAVKTAVTTPIDYELLTTAMFKKAIRSLYIDYYKPIFFIFDQFEELFIFGSKEEKQSLVHLVQSLVDSDIECRFIFIMREEYIANVTEFEKNVHGFLSNRVRIERMPHENAVMAIKGPCSVYDIDLEEGFPEKLLNKLSPESPDIELTYLQVFLDKIYNLVLKKKEEEKSTLRFSSDLLEKTGDVSDLLGSFLEEQISLMPDQDAALAVLKSFVSVKGTKRQLTLQEVKDNAYTLGKSIEEPLLVEMIQAFVHLRILRDKDQGGRYELRHDALASKIFEKISNIEKEILEIRQFVENAYYNWQKRDVLLTEDDLKYIGPYRSRLYLSEELSVFIEKSEKALEGRRRRRRQLAISIPTVIIIVLSIFTGWALIEKKKSDRNYIKARANYYRITAKEVAAKDPVAGLRLAQFAFSLDSTDESRRTMYDIYRDYNFYKTLTRLKSYIFWGAKFSPDGKSIILGSTDYALKLIDLEGRTIREFDCKGRTYFDSFTGVPSLSSGTPGGILSADYSPDGNNIAVGTADKVVYLFDKNGNRIGSPFKGHNRAIWSIYYSKDGSKILTGSADSTAILWDTLGNIIKRYRLIDSRMYNASISPDSRMVFVGGVQDGPPLETSILYNINGTKIREFVGHTAGVITSTYSSDSKNILTGSSDGTAVLWDINGNRLKEFIGHNDHVAIAEFSPDGKTILTGSIDNTLKLWNLNGSLIQELAGCTGGTFSPDGNQILGWSKDFSVKLWNIGDRKRPLFRMNDNWIRNVSFSNNKNLILTRGILYNEVLKDLDGNTIWESHDRISHSDISLSPDNEKLLLRSGNGKSLKICNLKSKAERVIIDTTGISSAVFMPDGNILVRFGSGSIKIDTGGRKLQTLRNYPSVSSVNVFTPDSKHLLSVSAENTFVLRDFDGRTLKEFKGHNGTIRYITVSPDGKKILTGSDDKTTILWDFDGNPVQVFKVNGGSISKVEFSPDGKNLLTIGSDVRVWNLKGYEIQRISGNEGVIISAAFSADGKGIITVHRNGMVNLTSIKMPLEEFLKKNDFDTLKADQKLEYGIISYSDAIKMTDPVQLFLAGSWYRTNDNIVDIKSRIENLDHAINLLEKSLSIEENAIVLLELFKAYNLKIFLTEGDKNSLTRRDFIESRISLLKEPSDIIEAAGYFYNTARVAIDTADIIYYGDLCAKLMEKIRGTDRFETRKSPYLENVYNKLSGIYFYQHEYKKAISCLLNRIALGNASESVYSSLVQAYVHNNQIDSAKFYFREHKGSLIGQEKFEDYVLKNLKSSNLPVSEYERIAGELNQ